MEHLSQASDGLPGSASARSVLVTITTEFMRDEFAWSWTQTLVTALGCVGFPEGSARRAIARAAESGWLESEKVGRRQRWRLTATGRGQTAQIAQAVKGGRQGGTWDGRWLFVLTAIPGVRAEERHALRAGLRWAGLGPIEHGAWVTPHGDALPAVEHLLERLGLTEHALVVHGVIHPPLRVQDVLRNAWDLGRLESAHSAFLADFGGRHPVAATDVFAAQVDLSHTWRRFLLMDPALPAELRDPGDVGAAAQQLFDDCRSAWLEPARQWFESVNAQNYTTDM